ncbi:hypothetical protein LHL20_20155 [Alteromonas sp. McT4-15]|uniref:hypothetical protein n=1 Tax=Alteromonas sp. McT4-15 TaxID=2881256 RepID=UPI001CF83309|nr:hypothetical protein [Alteromonas sp. McT4-15]MCB4438545.1 hypothetical protein [Alteromonas sp. McT4-15]
MRNLQLKSMLLVSHREKKARKISFHPKVTVIKGTNDTGKSSVIKSIPYCFGANPHKRHRKWKDADVITLIKFEVDGVGYAIYRHKNSFSLFDYNDNIIGTYSSVTNELGPVLAKIFDFNLKLTDRTGNAVTPPPAYLLLPFYIDQDKGWTDTWSSFTNLGQFAHWKQRVTGYHFGLRPDKWYALETQKKKAESERQEPLRQVTSINSIKERALKDLSHIDFDIDVDAFKSEINALLEECNQLKNKEQQFKKKLTDLKTEKIRLTAQIEIVARTHDELSDDYKYAINQDCSTIGCPTCGAEYDNSFAERFEIAQDTETCTDLLVSLRDDLAQIQRGIDNEEQSLSTLASQQNTINDLLASKQGSVRLQDLVDIEGKKSMIKHLEVEEKEQNRILLGIASHIDDIIGDMEKFDTPERRREIIREYGETLRRYTSKLGVHSLNDNAFKSITSSLDESGSDLPRAVLAYFFATQSAIRENGNSTLFPVIIDAPNQQEQDPDNLKKMLEFIYAQRAPEQQLIVGMVEDAGVEFEGDMLVFDKKYSVLNESEYFLHASELREYEAANLAL